MAVKILRTVLICLSHTPPIWLAASGLKTHSMPAWCILFRIMAWSIWSKAMSSSDLTPMKFVPLSHLICYIGPRRAIDRRKAWINESVSSELETSIWMALLASMRDRKSVGCRKRSLFLPVESSASCKTSELPRQSVVCPNSTIAEVSITGDLLLELMTLLSFSMIALQHAKFFFATQVWNKYMKHGREQLEIFFVVVVLTQVARKPNVKPENV